VTVRVLTLILTAVSCALASAAGAEEPLAAARIDSGDTAWMLSATALVLAMVFPGLALFYGGLVRSKNAIATIMHTFIILCIVAVLWVLIGYSLAFGPDQGGVIGALDWAGLNGVGGEPHPARGPGIPHAAFMLFELMFAAITPALITGAFAERIRFSALVLFTILWSIVVYCPLAHWIWGGGWLQRMGALDYAGGAVVHMSAGMSGLACAMLLGRRRGYGTEYMAPHNLPLAMLGTGMLWFGWFGFNGGSALGANALAVAAMVTTNTAAASGALAWLAVEWQHRGKPTVLGAASGAITGLASVSPSAGYVGVLAAAVVAATAATLCYFAIVWKGRLRYDDSLDVVGIHGVGGLVGLLGTGLFASRVGVPGQFGIQLLTAGATALYAFLATYVILKIVDTMTGLRVTPEQESTGLDLSQHNERAYS
jgi:ammonium transporter, Amt family